MVELHVLVIQWKLNRATKVYPVQLTVNGACGQPSVPVPKFAVVVSMSEHENVTTLLQSMEVQHVQDQQLRQDHVALEHVLFTVVGEHTEHGAHVQ
jgi:extradiol dioxygenase family protein